MTKKVNKIIILVAVFLAGAVAASASVYLGYGTINKLLGKDLPADLAAENAVKYINENLLAEGNVASLNSVSEEKVVYKFAMQIGNQEYESYVTKDGMFLFPEGYRMKGEVEASAKSDRPDVKLFIMSYCPYGLQAEKMFLPVYDLLKDKADMGIYFVDYIMHDKKEIDENLSQYCIQKEQNEKYASYLSCFVVSGDSAACLSEAGIDTEKVNSCVSQTDEEFSITSLYNDKSTWLNGTYPKFDVQADLNEQYGVSGSPTVVINGKVVDVSPRTPENFKEIICQTFNSQPDECSQALSEESPAPGFGGGTGSSSDNTCG
ncbi:MAG: hypothetical protein ISS83_02245 [Candidatus Pacebacteria bacterium]|nr:hypothetical protein [Candidatus Paceibacterota bacterium]